MSPSAPSAARIPRLVVVALYAVPVVVAAVVLLVGHLWQLALALVAVEGTVAGLTAWAARRPVHPTDGTGRLPNPSTAAAGARRDAAGARPAGVRPDAPARQRPPWLVIGAMFGVVGLLALLATLAARLG